MDKKIILKGIAKYYRMGSKGNRHKLVIDNISFSDWVKKEIEESKAKHKVKSEYPITIPQDFLRNKEIEVRLV